MADKDKQLQALREQIDGIDNQILDLLNRRSACVLDIGKIKQQEKGRFHVLEREVAIFERLMKVNKGPLPTEAIRPIFREIISASLALEKVLTIACLGPEGTFCHLAALQQFGDAVKLIQARGVSDIFDDVERGRAEYGVVPIENTTEGVVNLTLDMFIESPLHICAEIMLEISQCLLSDAKRLEDIKTVYSHPQALAQCYGWLSKNLPHAQIKETGSTAMAAQVVRGRQDSAAIASEYASRKHGVPICSARIEDNPQNFTRFWVIGKTSPGKTGSDKTSLMFSIKDGVGALHAMLQPFARHDVNLSKIESRPFRKKPWEYIFFLDIEGHMDDTNVQSSLRELSESSDFIKVLGSYPKSNHTR